MTHLLIFGLGYTASHIAATAQARGWKVDATGRNGNLGFEDESSVRTAILSAKHVLSSVPPEHETGADPVLNRYGDALGACWLGYLSSTGVYGNTGGAWVDETAPTGTGRRVARARCDGEWLARKARIFRLPGIYGPGRNQIDRVRAGQAYRIDWPRQVFSRIHVADIVSGVMAAMETTAAPGAYNLADDLPASQNAVVEEACRLLGHEPPALQKPESADIPAAARAFYTENRRIANGKAKRMLDWSPRYPTFREGLRELL